MSYPDLFNASLEAVAGLFIGLSCWRLYNDKKVRGVNVITVGFFAFWGFWNLYYYPHLGQWLSFWGGIVVVTVNTFWMGQMLYYGRGEEDEG